MGHILSCLRRVGLLAAVAAVGIAGFADAAPKNHTPANSAALTQLLTNKSSAVGPLELGDTVTLTAGVNYDAHTFTLPEINAGVAGGWITFQSSAAANLPGPDVRVEASHAQYMPKIRMTGTYIALVTADPPSVPHHYKFIGIEFSSANSNMSSYSTTLVRLGKGDISQNSSALVPHHFVFDRCYFHTYDDLNQRLRRGIEIHTAHTDIINCRITGIKETGGADSQAICGWNGPGPYRIINNYMEAASETIMFGGAVAHVPNVVPSDIEIRRNHMTKPIEWRSNSLWNVKNLFEIKTARRVTLDGNIFEKTWSSRYGQQHGAAIVLKTLTSGQAYKNSEDIIFRNNIVRDCGMGVVLEGRDTSDTNQGVLRRVTVENNTFEIDHLSWSYDTVPAPNQHYEGSTGFNGAFMQFHHSPQNITVNNNTIINSAYMLAADKKQQAAVPNFKFFNNILRNKDAAAPYGGLSVPTGATAQTFFPAQFDLATMMFRRNVLMGAPTSQYQALSNISDNLTPGYSPTWTNILKNYAGGNVSDNFSASTSTTYNLHTYAINAAGTATNKPIGADTKYIHDVATKNVLTGNPLLGAEDILLYARDATVAGTFQLVDDTTAAAGRKVWNPNAGAAKIVNAVANPANYMELTFHARAGVPYRIWARMRAEADHYNNDSVFVQFNNSMNSSGTPMWRTGTTDSTTLVLEDQSGAWPQAWGWCDNGYGPGVLGPVVYFATNGPQTIRIQQREDGAMIDQVLLSPLKYATSSPGTTTNDTRILPQQSLPVMP
jgi:hypothetical protein